MENSGIAVWWSLPGKQPSYSFSWQVLLSQVLILTQQVYNWYNHVLNLVNNTNNFILVES